MKWRRHGETCQGLGCDDSTATIMVPPRFLWRDADPPGPNSVNAKMPQSCNISSSEVRANACQSKYTCTQGQGQPQCSDCISPTEGTMQISGLPDGKHSWGEHLAKICAVICAMITALWILLFNSNWRQYSDSPCILNSAVGPPR